MNKIKLEVGMNVKIIKGTEEKDHKDLNYKNYQHWIAGSVPIGAIGKINLKVCNNNYKQFYIDFPDYPILKDKAERGFYHALKDDNLPDWLEVVN